jgi:hypothetical protein
MTLNGGYDGSGHRARAERFANCARPTGTGSGNRLGPEKLEAPYTAMLYFDWAGFSADTD